MRRAGAASASSCSLTPRSELEFGGLTIAEGVIAAPVLSSRSVSTSPAASTARPEVASTLKHATRRSMPAMPMAESSAPIVVWISVTNQRHQHHDGDGAARVSDVARNAGRGGENKDDCQADEKNVERDFIRGLLPFGPFDQLDHAVQKCRSSSGAAVMRTRIQSDSTRAFRRSNITAERSPPGLANDRRRSLRR